MTPDEMQKNGEKKGKNTEIEPIAASLTFLRRPSSN